MWDKFEEACSLLINPMCLFAADCYLCKNFIFLGLLVIMWMDLKDACNAAEETCGKVVVSKSSIIMLVLFFYSLLF